MRSRPWLWVLGLTATLASSPALARPLIVVLAFGGDQGTEVRDRLVAALAKKYEVLHGQKLLEACDQLGITMSRGKNLARAAAHLGAVAVVGGSIKEGHLVLAVYSGKTGQPLAAGPVPFGGEITRPTLGKALTLILKGLNKAPKKVARTGLTPDPAAPMPEPRPKNGGGGKLAGGTGGSLTYDPNAPDAPPAGAGTTGGTGAEENPLTTPPAGAAPAQPPPPPVQSRPPGVPRPTRIQALLGLGSWIRSFSMNDVPVTLPNGVRAPVYNASAFILRLDLRLYPVAFFLENWPAGFIIQMQYQQALGLSSMSPQKDTTGAEIQTSFGTTMRQFLFGAGYDWKILPSAALSPHLELKLGFGLMDFSIDWTPTATVSMPAASYRFFLADLGFRYDFFTWLGAHLGFDYRAVSGTGEIEDDLRWFGASSTGGINLSLGLHGGWKGIRATAEYAYTRYFYAFVDPAKRQTDGKAAAGGALDILHTLMVSVGYAF